MNPALQRYVTRKGYRKVGGWLHDLSANFTAWLLDYQTERQYCGSVGEIGVHHGRLFILLHLGNSACNSFAIDIFDDQHLNTDFSGKGDSDIFIANVRRWGGDIAEINVIQKSSLIVKPAELPSPVRMFSVDGGHTAECAYNDLRLADQTLAEHGVVILDDYFNPCWPDVSVGANQYLTSNGSNLKPFAITPSKLFLARPALASDYEASARQRWSKYIDAQNIMFDSSVTSFGIRMSFGLSGRIRQLAKNVRR